MSNQLEKDILNIGPKTTERLRFGTSIPCLADANIYVLGQSRVPEGPFDFHRSNPPLQQVLVVTSGRGRAWFRNQWHDLTEGDAFLCPAYEPHGYHVVGAWEIVWCVFHKIAFPELQEGPAIRKANTLLWNHLILGLLEESDQQSDSTESLEYWIALLRLESQRLIESGQKHSLRLLWSQVKRNLSHHWTLDLLAQRANLNMETLRQRCLLEYKMSPIAYLTYLRMQHAADMLRRGLKVEYVAQAVGYESPFAFSTAFKRVMKRSPNTFKPRHY